MFDIFFSFVASLVMTLVIGKYLIPYLRVLKFGQSILEIGPKWHLKKQGIPTMGGIMFIVPTTIVTLILSMKSVIGGDWRAILVLGFALICGGIGMIDDYTKVVKHQNQGLTALQKLLLQIAAAAVFLVVLRLLGYMDTRLYIPFFHRYLELPWIVYLVFAAVATVAMVNATNLTDGVDGLAASVTFPVVVFFAVMAISLKVEGVSVFTGAFAGGLLGFLFYNFHPAKIFMGDTGSLFLGGAVCALAFVFDIPLILFVVGQVYIIEVLSDVIQVLYFKATHGKRFFKMAPIHHHFEMCGWSEVRVTLTFAFVTVALCVVAYLGICNGFLR